MRYPIAIEPGDDEHSFGVIVPDLPGCFSAGDTVEEAIANSEEAILLWLEDAFESERDVPDPRPIEEHWGKSEFKGFHWALVSIDAAKIMGPAERINITVPTGALQRIDSAAEQAGESRSSFLVNAALKQLREGTAGKAKGKGAAKAKGASRLAGVREVSRAYGRGRKKKT